MTATARIKVTHRLPVALATQIAERARQRRVSQTAVVEAALASFFSPDGSDRLEGAISRRLDRQGRQIDNLAWNVDLTNETFRLFIRFWLTSNPPLPDTALPAAQATGRERWEQFIEMLARRIESDARLRGEISRDVPAREVP